MVHIEGVCFERIRSIQSVDQNLVGMLLRLKQKAQIIVVVRADGFTVKDTKYSPSNECGLSLKTGEVKEIIKLINSETIWTVSFYLFFENEVLVGVVPVVVPQK